jgi:hypothetical protein
MPKRIANGLTLLSAVVCVRSALLVGRSWFRVDLVGTPLGQGHGGAYTLDGRLFLWQSRRVPEFFHYYHSESAERLRYGLSTSWREIARVPWLSLGWHNGEPRCLVLPLWLLPLLTAIPPVRWWRARRREGGRGFAVDGVAPRGGMTSAKP